MVNQLYAKYVKPKRGKWASSFDVYRYPAIMTRTVGLVIEGNNGRFVESAREGEWSNVAKAYFEGVECV